MPHHLPLVFGNFSMCKQILVFLFSNTRVPSSTLKIYVWIAVRCVDSRDLLSVSYAVLQVTKERGEQLAIEYGIKFMETSAKASIHVEEAFFTLARDIKMKMEKKLVSFFFDIGRKLSSVTLIKTGVTCFVSHEKKKLNTNLRRYVLSRVSLFLVRFYMTVDKSC